MTTSDVSTQLLNRAGNKRGLHPNCRKNLRPGNPPVDAHLTGYSLTSRLKRAMERPLEKPKDDAPAGDHIVYATLTGAKDLIPVAFKEAWERTEGKVPEPPKAPSEPQGNRIINIFVGTDRAKELIDGLTKRLGEASAEPENN